jgi:hypothetical protein
MAGRVEGVGKVREEWAGEHDFLVRHGDFHTPLHLHGNLDPPLHHFVDIHGLVDVLDFLHRNLLGTPAL